jgi:hypothetical protein
MQTAIIEQNKLIRNDYDIFVPQDEGKRKAESVDVSDSNEQFIKKIIPKTEDLSSTSTELDAQWVYWSSEYHLNSMRSNLMRCLDLTGIDTALEIGAGCGAITRYLGEAGIQVDAFEENSSQAEIASMRCRDLDNVNVINLNFKDLSIPDQTYDAVFLIDAFDNDGLKISSYQNHQDAVIKILARLKSGLNQNGALYIAAANRMGLKYWMGALSNNANKAYIGLDGYPDNPQTRTYDCNEWRSLLAQAGLLHCRFAYPFPDHLLTRATLSDQYIKTDCCAYSLLYHIKSRDYFNPDWRPDDDEFLRWEALHNSGYLTDFANSFLIAAADVETPLTGLWPYDFIHFSNPSRQKKYRTVTLKRRDVSLVSKEKIFIHNDAKAKNMLSHAPMACNYLKGSLLASKWVHAFLSADIDLVLQNLVNEYCHFLTDYFNTNQENNSVLDLLPFNIIVDSQGRYQVFDLEWQTTTDLNPNFILFRALMWFGYTHETIITPFCEQRNLHTIGDFIIYVFNLMSPPPLEYNHDQFIAIEEQIHKNIASGQEPEPVKQLMQQPFQYIATTLQSKSFNAQLYWVDENETLTNKNSITVSAPLSDNSQMLFFKLPPHVSNIKIIRFDPADRTGFFHLTSVQLKWCDKKGDDEMIMWELKDARNIAAHAIMENVHFCPSAICDAFIATSEDPQMIFELPDDIWPPSINGSFLFKAKMDWPKSADYLASVEMIKKMALELKEKETLIAEKEKRMVEYHAQLKKQTEIGDQVKERDMKIHILEFKLNLIKKSGLGKIFKAFKIF